MLVRDANVTTSKSSLKPAAITEKIIPGLDDQLAILF